MTRLQDEVAVAFLEALVKSPDVTPQMVESLRYLLARGKKITADDLVNVFGPDAGGELK